MAAYIVDMYFSKILLAGAFLALASPVAVLANTSQSPATESAALNRLSQSDRAQVQNVLGLLSVGQVDAGTAVAQIDAVLSDNEVKSVLAYAKEANIDAQDAGQFLVDLARPSSK